jgi:dihydrofolate reductase
MNARNVILYIAMSLDGYIADADGDIGFLRLVEKDGEDYGYSTFSSSTDVVILGRKTWDTVLSFNIPELYSGKKVYVVSSGRKGQDGIAEYYNGDLGALIGKLKSETGLDIHIDGGGELVFSLLKEKLIDRMVVSVIPVLLGGGTRLFRPSFTFQKIKLTNCLTFSTGLVQLHYETIK